MDMESSLALDLLGVAAIALLVLMNGFFVAAEFALVSVRRTRVAELVSSGEAGALSVQKAIHNPDRVIAATQLGITLASLALGWVGEPALAHLFEPLFKLFSGADRSQLSHSISAAFSFAIITFLHVVVGELAPKSIALQNPERTSLIVAGATLWTERVFKPVIWALNGTGNWLLRLVGIKPVAGHQLLHSVEELKMLVTASADGGVVGAEEREMLHAIFDFGDQLVRQVMIPRTEVVALPADAHLDEIVSLAVQHTYSKFPVYEGGVDQIIGVVHVKDILSALQDPNSREVTARKLARDTLFVPETVSVSSLLHLFRDKHQHLAIVMDEFGGTSGVVTLEDLLEEIVGEVSGPFDTSAPGFQVLSDGSILVDGLTTIEDVNQHLGLHLQDPYYDTIAGYVLGKLGRIPSVNEVIETEEVRLKVEEMDGMRIARVILTRLPKSSASDVSLGAGSSG